ncbi:PDZ domain-containing protein [Escherichia coli]|nr:PDZ domain-containing protein [Escherichia coli]
MSNKGKDQGVVVNNVKTGTLAAQIGLKKGDVIIGANQQAVKNIAELRKVLDKQTVCGCWHSTFSAATAPSTC